MNRKIIFEKLHDTAIKNPQKVAISLNHSEITYLKFWELVNTMSQNILRYTKGENEIIPIRIYDRKNALISIFAIYRAGCAWVALDKEIKKDKCLEIINEIEPKFIISDNSSEEDLHNNILSFDELLERNENNGDDFHPRYHDDLISYILYTSGTTGKPKGCVISDNQLISKLITLDNTFEFTENDNYLFSTNYSFDVSITEIFGWVFSGGKVTIYDDSLPEHKIPEFIFKKGVTHIAFSPSFFKVFFKNNEEYFRNVKFLFLAGEKFPVDLARTIKSSGLKMKTYNLYGPTETTIYATYFNISELSHEANSVPIGYPLNNVKIKIDNPDKDGLGEILIGGEGVSNGYYKRKNLNNEKFININNERFYRSGDIGKIEENTIYFYGRIDNQMKINGIRVEPEEIELTIKKFEHVEDVVVKLETYDQKDILVAFIVAKEQLNKEDIFNFLKDKIESYFIPKYYVQIDELPLNKNKKVDYHKLSDIFKTHIKRRNIGSQFETQTESIMSEVWGKILKIPVSRTDNFFQIGGDSLDTVSLLLEIEEIFELQLNVSDIIKYPVLSELCEFIDRLKREHSNFLNEKDLSRFGTTLIKNNETVLYLNKETSLQEVKLLNEKKEISVKLDRIIPVNNFRKKPTYSLSSFNNNFDYNIKVDKFPLFSRQEFYLRKNFNNNYLIKEVTIRDFSKEDIIEAIYKLINNNILLRSIISESTQEFVELKSVPLELLDINYIELDNYKYEDAVKYIKKITNDLYMNISSQPIFNNILYNLVLVKFNLNVYKLIFVLNHHIADASALNNLERQVVSLLSNNSIVINDYDYRQFTYDVINKNNDNMVNQLLNSNYYKTLKKYLYDENSIIERTPDAPIYRITPSISNRDLQKKDHFIFDFLIDLFKEEFEPDYLCFQILKNLEKFNNKELSGDIGDYHVSVFVPFNTKKDKDLYKKSEDLLKYYYEEKGCHIDYICSSNRYLSINDTQLFGEIYLSINYLGEFTDADFKKWEENLLETKNNISKLNQKIRITCFYKNNKPYIYILGNLKLSSKFDKYIF
ncbi:non-ribosomal peptide synthetase [Caldifermentibacillus hisashii]|jgi:amino acid adenylation domain-containing protein|uniref:Non-ribosomal peptide synthetase n=1 Tax=Caldifermentibacillus hisashii TaxID=996558 RepID=A0ABU9JUE0_9BACI